MVEPLVEAADFIPSGAFNGKERLLSWCPTTDQINLSSRHTFTFRARRRRGESWSEGIKKRYHSIFHEQLFKYDIWYKLKNKDGEFCHNNSKGCYFDKGSSKNIIIISEKNDKKNFIATEN